MEENREPDIKNWQDTALEPTDEIEIADTFGQDFTDFCKEHSLHCWKFPNATDSNRKDLYIEIKDRTLELSQDPKDQRIWACHFSYTADLQKAFVTNEPDINEKLYTKNHKVLDNYTLEFGRIARDLINSLSSTDIIVFIEAEPRRLHYYKKMFGENNPSIRYKEIINRIIIP